MIRLGVNIDHVATLRQVRKTDYPQPIEAAILAEQAGADGITFHLREDRRHIQPQDVWEIKEKINVPLNFEMAATEEMVSFALEILPTYCCIVPERREELTTEGGLRVADQASHLANVIERLKSKGILVSLFIEPIEREIMAAKEAGADIIELHTGKYAQATAEKEKRETLAALQKGAHLAAEIGLQVNGGHGLNVDNVIPVAAIPQMIELNIGHAIVSRAIMVGMKAAVMEIRTLMQRAREG